MMYTNTLLNISGNFLNRLRYLKHNINVGFPLTRTIILVINIDNTITNKLYFLQRNVCHIVEVVQRYNVVLNICYWSMIALYSHYQKSLQRIHIFQSSIKIDCKISTISIPKPQNNLKDFNSPDIERVLL